jgi:predicted HAD superfamily Cof-like phosphohydrolase
MENFDSLLQRTCDWNTAVGNYKGVGVDAELEGSLLREEVEEIITAIKNKDPKEVVDGVMDVLFVAIGTLHKMGHEFWDFQSEYEAVVDSNFTKFPFTKREDGKVKKSENFKAPELYVY